MKRVLAAMVSSIFYAIFRGRILLALALGYFVLALPTVLPFSRALRENTNHRANPAELGKELNFDIFSTLRTELSAADGILLASILGAFLLGLFTAGGWLEVLANRRDRDASPGLKVFCAGGGARFFRYLRLSVISLSGIAAAGWIFYGMPFQALQRFLCGSDDLIEFQSEGAANRFVQLRSTGFLVLVGWTVLVSDLARAAIVVRGGRSAVLAALRGFTLFVKNPLKSVTAGITPFLLELLILSGLAWCIRKVEESDLSYMNLFLIFVLTQIVVMTRELIRAGRLGAMLVIAEADMDIRMERKFGIFADPVIAAAGRAMTDDEG
jgi:hypothetical protein